MDLYQRIQPSRERKSLNHPSLLTAKDYCLKEISTVFYSR